MKRSTSCNKAQGFVYREKNNVPPVLITHKLYTSWRLSFFLFSLRHFVDNVTGFYFIFIGILHGFSGSSSSSSRRRSVTSPPPRRFSILLSSTRKRETHTHTHTDIQKENPKERGRTITHKQNELSFLCFLFLWPCKTILLSCLPIVENTPLFIYSQSN